MAPTALPDRARVVVIGGGVIGCSIAYHLAHEGWTDVVVLERDRLTSGTTWHAAGLIVRSHAFDDLHRATGYSPARLTSVTLRSGP